MPLGLVGSPGPCGCCVQQGFCLLDASLVTPIIDIRIHSHLRMVANWSKLKSPSYQLLDLLHILFVGQFTAWQNDSEWFFFFKWLSTIHLMSITGYQKHFCWPSLCNINVHSSVEAQKWQLCYLVSWCESWVDWVHLWRVQSGEHRVAGSSTKTQPLGSIMILWISLERIRTWDGFIRTRVLFAQWISKDCCLVVTLASSCWKNTAPMLMHLCKHEATADKTTFLK